jgi:hypothetical protein
MSPDLIFSYWIFVLFIVYYTIHKYYELAFMNPTILLWIALCYQLLALMYYVYKKLPAIVLLLFFIIMLLVKALPLYLLRNSKGKNNVLFSLVFFIIYLAYLDYKGTSFIKVYEQLNESIVKVTDDSPFFKVFGFIKNMKSVQEYYKI